MNGIYSRKCVKMAKKVKKIYKYKDWILDSQGEVDMCYWMEELKTNKYINSFDRGQTLNLSNSFVNSFTTKLKTKSRINWQTILLKHDYTYDFIIDWTDLGLKYFCNRVGEKWLKPFIINSKSMSFIENKPQFDFQNMNRLVTLNIKWIWQQYQIFIQLIKNDELFKETFVPKALLTTKTGKKRVFKFPVRTLEEYLKTIK